MPYSKPSDAPDWVADDKKAQWVEVWNSVYKAKKKDGLSDKEAEGEAFKQAGGVVSDKKRSREMNKRECRYSTELRAESQGDEMSLVGYASVFNSESHDLGGFKEVVAPSAFTRSLKDGADVKATFNHDPNRVLGRTKSGTLTLSTDDRGLKFRVALDKEQQLHRDIYRSVMRGDISECSFAFMVPEGGQDWKEVKGNDDFYAMRTLTDVDLLDVSAVTYPAYPGTNVDARKLFPDGEVAEIRSAIETLTSARKAAEQRADEDSLEEEIQEVQAALSAKYPVTDAGECCAPSCGKYWVVETHEDYVIVCEWGTDDYWKIPYTETTEDNIVFGDPQAVEKTYVPVERALIRKTAGSNAHAQWKEKVQAHIRSLSQLAEGHAAAAADAKNQADAAAATAAEHEEAARILQAAQEKKDMCSASMGDCDDPNCECQNRDCNPDDIWCEGDDEDEENDDRARVRSARRAGLATQIEFRADGKVRTKTVGGKALTKDKFAFVGDPEKTETWKLPIHDADHVRNALARFNQTEGIPADQKDGVLRKIKAAAKKFGIDVSDDNRALDTDEVQDRLRRLRVAMLT